ncbi:MAG: protein serine phosphatase [Rhodopirellula sp.]|nr:protein serine phosphatase [Rhodopirellula sp.]|tara:strand:+ start:23353 stop:25020 length:1668 start_codon:yes stop_codon:yes gene_type:complete
MAYLKAKNGPLAGQRIELSEDEMILGRSPDCNIQVEDYAVSRKHAKVIRSGDAYSLEDLKSRNKTYLNDIVLTEGAHQLRNGDKVAVCDVIFNFYDELAGGMSDSLDGSRISVLFDGNDVGHSTIMSKLEVGTSKGNIQLAASPEMKLSALLEITRALGNALGLDDVLPSVLDALFKVFMQADRAFIALMGDDGNLIPRWSKARRDDCEETIRISRTIVNHVIELREAVLSADAASDQQFDASQSIADFQIRSMMCAPLFDVDGEPIGVLQVDTLERNKQFNEEDLEVLVSVATQAGIAIDNARLHDDALAQAAIKKDLELAAKVQAGFLPNERPHLDGYEFYDYYKAANFIGGDYYDYLEMNNGNLAIIVADVVGHGVAAAMLMAKLSAETRFCLAGTEDVAQAIINLNNRMTGMALDRFVTFLLVMINSDTHEITLVNAGHMAPFHRKTDGTVDLVGEDYADLPIGIMEDVEYQSYSFHLAPGESLTMYTDGLNEQDNGRDELFGIEAIGELVKQHQDTATERGERILQAVTEFSAGAIQGDDMCLVALNRTD